jgi:hypothetical protein
MVGATVDVMYRATAVSELVVHEQQAEQLQVMVDSMRAQSPWSLYQDPRRAPACTKLQASGDQ